jgi:hypothetical protein
MVAYFSQVMKLRMKGLMWSEDRMAHISWFLSVVLRVIFTSITVVIKVALKYVH